MTGAVLNLSNKTYDMIQVANAINHQLNKVFSFSYRTELGGMVKVSMSAKIRPVESFYDTYTNDDIYVIENNDRFRKSTVLASHPKKSRLVLLSTELVDRTIGPSTPQNNASIAHETGHLAGLPDNPRSTVSDPGHNLMTQAKYLNGYGSYRDQATKLEASQVKQILANYKNGKLRSRHIPIVDGAVLWWHAFKRWFFNINSK